MKKLNKLSIKYFTAPFFATFFISLFVLIMQFLWKYIDDLAGKGLEWYVIFELIFFASAHLIPLALPLAVLLSSMMTFGSLAENNELMAYKSSGVSLVRIFRPLGILVIFFAFGSFLFSNYALPKANLRFGALLWDVKTQKPAFDIREGVFYNGIDGYSIRVKEKDNNTNEIKDVLVYDHTKGTDNNIVIKAESGKMSISENQRWLTITLFDGYRYEEIRNLKNSHIRLPHSKTKFKEYEIKFDLSQFEFDRTNVNLFRGNYRMLNMTELKAKQDSIEKEKVILEEQTREYLKPYLYFLRDSSLSDYEAREMHFDSANFISNFIKNNNNILGRAKSNARTIKFILRNPSIKAEFQKNALIRYQIEWHRKIILSLVIIILFLMGAPMGAIIRKGGLGLPSIVSVFMFIAFHIISIIGEKLAKKYVLEPWIGMWLPVFILLPIGLILVYKANKDSIHFGSEFFSKVLSKYYLVYEFFQSKRGNMKNNLSKK
ncbi:MAG: LptF/LptG family permease [Bacteroidota bacterium]|nr:LptF/LptG family permease [Bacteroidota bacterium]